MQITFNQITTRKNELLDLKSRLEKKKRSYPPGKIQCKNCRGNFQYYYNSGVRNSGEFINEKSDTEDRIRQNYALDGKVGEQIRGLYLKKSDHDIAQMIAEREYIEKVWDYLCKELKYLDGMEKLYKNGDVADCYEKQCEARKALVTPIVKGVDQLIREFMEEEYRPAAFDEDDHSDHRTILGERVRSKSEKMIANEFYHRGIPYRYEKPLVLNDWNRMVEFRPDFTAINICTGKRIYLEHLGMMDNYNYMNNTMHKIEVYEKNGILVGRDLILTHETSRNALSTSVLNQYIETFFLN